jgi:hypothetical protein
MSLSEQGRHGELVEPLPRSRETTAAFVLMIVGWALFVVLFAVMWGPFYLGGSYAGVILYPVIFLFLPVLAVLAVLAIVFSARGLAQGVIRGGRARAMIALIGGCLLFVLPLPLLWFGAAA